MAEKRRALTKWELVDQIKICGDAIEDNADDMVGDYEKFDQITVSFTIKKYDDEQTKIYVNKSYIPERRQKDARKGRNTKN